MEVTIASLTQPTSNSTPITNNNWEFIENVGEIFKRVGEAYVDGFKLAPELISGFIGEVAGDLQHYSSLKLILERARTGTGDLKSFRISRRTLAIRDALLEDSAVSQEIFSSYNKKSFATLSSMMNIFTAAALSCMFDPSGRGFEEPGKCIINEATKIMEQMNK